MCVPMEDTAMLKSGQTIADFHRLNVHTNHGAFPVVAKSKKLVGIVTAKDVIGKEETELIDKVMTKQPISVSMKTSVASAGHRMVWEGIDLLPVVSDDGVLQGVITRQDVLKALQTAKHQPQHGETIDDIVKGEMKVTGEEDVEVEFTTILTEVGLIALKRRKRGDAITENITIYFIKPIQMENVLKVVPHFLDLSRKFVKMDFDVYSEQNLVGKAMITYQLLDR